MTEHARTGPTRFQLWSLGAGSWEPICFWQFSSCFPLEDIASLPSRLGNQKSTGGGWRGCISQPAWLGIPLRILPPEAKHGTPVVTPWPDSPVFPNARPKSETLTWQTPLMSLNPPRSQTQVISMMGTAMTDTTHPGPGHLQEAAAVVTPVMTPATHTPGVQGRDHKSLQPPPPGLKQSFCLSLPSSRDYRWRSPFGACLLRRQYGGKNRVSHCIRGGGDTAGSSSQLFQTQQ
ncbi:uncharacterized protein LOC128930748 isoform X6 [Callithrix jacchus]